MMKKYTFRVDSRTRQSLRLLSSEWTDYKIFQGSVVINLCNGRAVILQTHIVDKQEKFECSRICAEMNLSEQVIPQSLSGPNRVEVLEAEEWIETYEAAESENNLLGVNPISQNIGLPSSSPTTALAACLSHNGVLITFPQGSKIAFVCGVMPGTIEIMRDSPELEELLTQRAELKL